MGTKHARRQVREAAVADLTGLATTGSNVFTSRVSPLSESEMPGMYVMLRDERADIEGQALGKVARTGNLVIEAWAQGGEGLEDTLDGIAAEVETAIYGATPQLSGVLQNIGAPTTQVDLPASDDNSRRTGIIRILFPVVYRTALSDPTTISN